MKLKTIIYAAFGVVMLAGCSEDSYLDNKPQGVLSDENMKSVKGVDLLVNSAYAALGGPEGQSWSVWIYPTTNWSYGSVRSDDAYKGGGGVGDVSDINKIETMDIDATNGNLDGKW